MNYVEEYKDGVLLSIYVKPRSGEEKIILNDEIIYFSKEKPEKGRVNRALIKFLSKNFEIPYENIKIISGERSRSKKIYIKGMDPNQLLYKIKKLKF